MEVIICTKAYYLSPCGYLDIFTCFTWGEQYVIFLVILLYPRSSFLTYKMGKIDFKEILDLKR